VIKIEVRQNKIFEMGYPYNSSADDYFKSLTPSFINNYGLSKETVIEINNHKNKTLFLDIDLHTYIVSLSEFIIEFETTGTVLINEFEDLINIKTELESKYNIMFHNKTNAIKEYDFVISNIDQLQIDIEKVNGFIEYYQSQVIDETYSYTDSYIEDTQTTLSMLHDVVIQNENDFEYYKNTLYDHITSLVEIKDELKSYSFMATTLRSMYEEWKKRSELYFQNLVTYFKDEYDSYWTYGSSMMYGEKKETETASMAIYNQISERWQSTLFKRYNFSIEIELKEYSLWWLENKVVNTFDSAQFIFSIESKKVEILKRELINIESLISDKKQAIRSVILYEKEQNYFKYREFVLAKRQYLYAHINSTIDQAILDDYDTQISLLQDDYEYVVTKFSQTTYWKYFSDWEMHSELLIDLQRQLIKSEKAIIHGYEKIDNDNEQLMIKLDFYNKEKNILQTKKNELISMKEKIEVDNNIYSDETSILESQIYETLSLINQKRNQYVSYFDNRISFFIQDADMSEHDGIIALLRGSQFNKFDESYNEFINYYCNVEWYAVETREKLKTHYDNLLKIINKNFLDEWNKEFSHPILDTKKKLIYAYYIDKEMRTMYALINKHLLDNRYVSSFNEMITEKLIDIKKIFSVYVKIAFNIKENISIITSLFDYEEILIFTISEGNETIENVKATFDSIVDNIVVYACNKNIEFKVFETEVNKQQKINYVWLDMEKKYV